MSPLSFQTLVSFLSIQHTFVRRLDVWKTKFVNAYSNSDVTPYIHAVTAHLEDILRRLASAGLAMALFSTSAQEKKNHLQVNFFMEKTFKGGLNPSEPEASILMAEGRKLLFIYRHADKLKTNGHDYDEVIKNSVDRGHKVSIY